MKILFIYPNEMMLNPPPVSIGIFTAILKNAGFEVALFDTTYYQTSSTMSDKAKETNLQVRPFDYEEKNVSLEKTDLFGDLQNKIETFWPDLITISILESTYVQAISILDIIQHYKIPVVVGGVFPTFAPAQILSHLGVNFVCIGEGEGPLLELCMKMRNGEDISKIRNFWIRKGSHIIKNRIRLVVSLDNLPCPDYDLFEPKRFLRPMAGKIYRTVSVETNRGCIYSCAYCNSPSQSRLYREHKAGNFFRKKSMECIQKELRRLINLHDAEYVYFPSDTFLSMTDREFKQFIEIYSEFRLPFWIQTRVETITKEKMLELKRVGCHRMSLGIEHGNFEFRKKVLKKNISNEAIIKACNIIADVGIPLTVNNIIGFPDETRELVFDTININRQLVFDTTNAYVFSPFHGTSLHRVCLEKGLISKSQVTKNLTIDIALNMPQLPRSEVEGLRKTFALYTRLPKKYWPKIKKAEGNDKEAQNIFNELRSIYISKYFS